MARVTHLLETPRLVVGEFSCPPGDDAWSETNHIGNEPHVVFPLLTVGIDQLDKGSVLATPNHTIFYDAGQLYHRELRNDGGDHSIFISLRPETLEAVTRGLPRRVVDADRRLRPTHAPNPGKTFLARHLLVRRLRGHVIERAAAEATALALVRATLSQVLPEPRVRRERTALAHRELAETAKAELARAFTGPLSLPALAQRLHTSPFHLARVFRSETGFSVDGYRRAMRLRAALERLPTHAEGLSRLALELGFSSHSHFTETFRREFGVSPSALR